MATGPKKGLWVAKKVGSGPDNGGFDTYEIASGYGTSIFTGDPVKVVAGKIQKAANGDDVVGILIGVHYTDVNGTPQHKPYWPASYVPPADKIYAKVMNDPFRTFNAVGNGVVDEVLVGGIYAADMSVPGNTTFGLSELTIDVTPAVTGNVALPASGSTALVGNVGSLANNDVFTVKAASNSGAATSITILTATTRDDFMTALNAVPNIEATLTEDLYLRIKTTDGTSLVIADGAGAPLTDFGLTAGTTVATVNANAGMVKVQKVVDVDNRVLEVTLVNSSDRDNG